MRSGTFRRDDGTEIAIILQTVNSNHAADRWRKEMAAAELSATLWSTFPVTTRRSMIIDGNEIESWVQESRGTPLEDSFGNGELRRRAKRIYGNSKNVSVARLVREDPVIRILWEQAAIERAIMSDVNDHPRNKVWYQTSDGENAIGNAHIEQGFCLTRTPVWLPTNFKSAEKVLYQRLAEAPLKEQTCKRIEQFIKIWNNQKGRTRLKILKLSDPEIDCLLVRALWFQQHRTFPCIKIIPVIELASENQ